MPAGDGVSTLTLGNIDWVFKLSREISLAVFTPHRLLSADHPLAQLIYSAQIVEITALSCAKIAFALLVDRVIPKSLAAKVFIGSVGAELSSSP